MSGTHAAARATARAAVAALVLVLATPTAEAAEQDDGRTAVLVASSVGFGIGGFVTGTTYLLSRSSKGDTLSTSGQTQPATGWLLGYVGFVGLVPSIPSVYVGARGKGVLLAAVRAASISTAALVDWGTAKASPWGPIILGALLPVGLGIAELATTPHRSSTVAIHAIPLLAGGRAVGAGLAILGEL